jgi:hypothetical protein
MRLFEIDDTSSILKILNRHFKITGKIDINNGIVNITGNCEIKNKIEIQKLPVQFGNVSGDFNCDNNQLTTLESAPTSVGRGFYCNDNQLTTLYGAPKSVGREFQCDRNQLTTLEGAPTSVGRGFYCNGNQLTTLEGAPTSVGRGFYCYRNRLTTLEGAPTSVGGNFNCDNNQLTTLEGAPTSVGGEFHCSYNNSLPLLRLLLIKDVKQLFFYPNNVIVENILNKYLGQGRGGALACAAELTKAGYKGNARL